MMVHRPSGHQMKFVIAEPLVTHTPRLLQRGQTLARCESGSMITMSGPSLAVALRHWSRFSTPRVSALINIQY